MQLGESGQPWRMPVDQTARYEGNVCLSGTSGGRRLACASADVGLPPYHMLV